MCGLFGFTDTKRRLTQRQVNRLTQALAIASEQRGTDACGIAYNCCNKLYVYKRPVRAKRLRFNIPASVHTVLGHTRLATQGSEKKNYNNHPFSSKAGSEQFALAHNGVLHNDEMLRIDNGLPDTHIQTDSYVTVQLLESFKAVDHQALKSVAECLVGTFTLSVLDTRSSLFLVKGNNPLCVAYFSSIGLYVYASTEDILSAAIRHTGFLHQHYTKLNLESGDILEICPNGQRKESSFNTSLIDASHYPPKYARNWGYNHFLIDGGYGSIYEDLLSVAGCMGYSEEDIFYLLESGYSEEEVEEILYEAQPVTTT